MNGESVELTPTGFWLVSLPSGITIANAADYLAQGTWDSPRPANHARQLAAMRPGDLIALKITRTRRTGLPFFTADRPASAMAIISSGEVISVDQGTGTVRIKWNGLLVDREWYLFTYVRALAWVEPKGPRRLELFNFVFNSGPQIIERYLDHPTYWSDRFTVNPRLTWIVFFEEFATKLMEFRHLPGELLSRFKEVASGEPKLSHLVREGLPAGATSLISGPNPFTVMSAFNRSSIEADRISIARQLGAELGVTAPPPADFDAVPILEDSEPMAGSDVTDADRAENELLWDVFVTGVNLADHDSPGSRDQFANAYDTVRQVHDVDWELTVGLYWARPKYFVPLDNRTRAYIASHYGLATPVTGMDYLALLDALHGRMASARTTITSPALLSYAAFAFGTYDVPHTVDGFATWAMRISEAIDLEVGEHAPDRVASAILTAARQAALRGDRGWVTQLGEALQGNKTLSAGLADKLVEAAQQNPAATLAALNTVWDDPDIGSLDRLEVSLNQLLGYVSPIDATALGAALLMSLEGDSNAPYCYSQIARWHRLAGRALPTGGIPPSQRYADLLSFLDDLATAVEAVLGQPVSRLEVQRMATATTNHPVPMAWPADERAALRSWRDARVDAWLVRSSDSTVARWLDEGTVSVESVHLPTISADADLDQIRAQVEAGYSRADGDRVRAIAADAHTFLTLVTPGDYLVTQLGARLVVGIVEGAPEYDDTVPEGVDRLWCPASWSGRLPKNADGDLFATYLDRQGRLLSLSQESNALASLLEGPLDPWLQLEEDTVESPILQSPGGVPMLPAASPSLANRLHMDQSHIQEIIDLIQTRQQIVFFGPPGTGKTYLAKELGVHLAGPDRSRTQLIQFHPSYSYEDFFEGFRPTETASGQASFRLTSGPLRRIAVAAAALPEYPHVLIIDELNRANLAKVFGELYFLLEYRDESINLQYRTDESFRLPPNLFFIGTMNSADRSIALLDAAMRRRFSFVELHPDEPPVSGVLSKWLAAEGYDQQCAALLAALNEAIEEHDRDLRIGPSYFMRKEAQTEEGLTRVWKYDIMPLLEEHYFGRVTRAALHDRFGLAALRAALSSGAPKEPDNAAGDALDDGK